MTALCDLVIGNPKAVPRAIREGADVNERDHLGMTPLMYACTLGDLRTVRRLVAAGADVLAKDEHSGRDPMDYALHNVEIELFLLRNGGSLVSYFGESRVIHHLYRSQLPVLKALVHRGAEVPSKALSMACGNLGAWGEHEVVRLILKHVDDLNGDPGWQRTPLQDAMLEGAISIAKVLLQDERMTPEMRAQAREWNKTVQDSVDQRMLEVVLREN
jgi:ankyrin repeat protein